MGALRGAWREDEGMIRPRIGGLIDLNGSQSSYDWEITRGGSQIILDQGAEPEFPQVGGGLGRAILYYS